MLQSYMKIAFRNLLKNSVYSFINIAGLAIGIASSILIMLWVADEYAYDKFHANYDRIYKLYQSQHWAQGVGTSNSMPYPLSETVKNSSSQVKHIVMTNWGEGNMLQVGDKRINKIGLAASEDFFKVFSFKMLKGDPNTALTEPTSIVITDKLAKTLFDNSDPINQLIKVDNGKELKVTGVIKDIPRQSSFASFDYILPFSYFEATQTWVRNSRNNWENNSFQMYVELQPGASEADVNKSIENLIKDNNPKATTAKLFLHPISKWRLYSNFENGIVSGGIIEYVRLFSAIAVLVLLIACINFMNLATARSESRAREVGIRKSVGSRRKELIFQFIGESVILTFIAFLIAMVIVELVLPSYNLLVNKNIAINYGNPWLWIGAIGFIIIIGMFAGSYPAFYLSSFKPVRVLKGKITVGKEVSTPEKYW
jgi:putative ABC transport system permease protein